MLLQSSPGLRTLFDCNKCSRISVQIILPSRCYAAKKWLKHFDEKVVKSNAPSTREVMRDLTKKRRWLEQSKLLGQKGGSDSRSKQLFESTAALKYFERNLGNFGELTASANAIDAVLKEAKENNTVEEAETVQLPLADVHTIQFSPEKSASIAKPVRRADLQVNPGDRGFHVAKRQHCDEYVAGSLTELPDHELRTDRNLRSHPHRHAKKIVADDTSNAEHSLFGSTSPVEVIDFQLPHQGTKHPELEQNQQDDTWRLRYGTADPSIPKSDKSCLACGAFFHCQDTSLPGFLPAEYFMELERESFRNALCRRCHLLKHHDFLINVNVSTVNYGQLMSRLQTIQDCLILLVVDLLDFPSSIFPTLPEIIGVGKPMIVVGNKVDLLPPDGKNGYLERIKFSLAGAIEEAGLLKKMNVLGTHLISAKTGFGVEDLITHVQSQWGSKGDVYMVGCTNVGKSTLFNTFLQSDMCKVRAMDLVERAAISPWPGTTLNLLKFPLLNPTPYRLKEREMRLKQLFARQHRETAHRRMLLHKTRDNQYAVLQGVVEPTQAKLERPAKQQQPSSLFVIPESPTSRQKVWNPDAPDFAGGNWCYDTPGTVSKDQIINLLTLDELVLTIPRSLVIPRTFVLNRSETLIIAGLARLDFPEANELRSVLCTVFASRDLPVHAMATNELAEFIAKFRGTDVLKVPRGGEQRLCIFPELRAKEVHLRGVSNEESCADVVLSSAGWVSVTAQANKPLVLRAFTPGGVGVFCRQPALLPFAVNTRGKRIQGSNAYGVRSIVLPV